MRTETVYGFFHGGDPRRFDPDVECCSPEEIAAHQAACQACEEAESRGELPQLLACESGWETLPDGSVRHVLRSRFGIGVYTVEVPETREEAEELGWPWEEES